MARLPRNKPLTDDKAFVTSVKKYAMNGSSGATMDYDEFIGSPDLTKMFDSELLTVEQALAKLQEMGWDLAEIDEVATDSGADENERLNALVSWAQDNGKSDNTYNWSWWGPVLNFTGVQAPNESGDPYEPELYFVRTHRGGDVRGNYGSYAILYVESPGEQAPWYAWTLTAELALRRDPLGRKRNKDDGNEVILDSEGAEAYHWIVERDPSGTFEGGQSVTSDDLESAFEWDDGVRFW